MTLGVAIVGCGLVGAKRAAALPATAELVAVFDPDPARADAVVGAVAEPSGRTVVIGSNAQDAIEHDDVGLVIIATPHRELPSLACRALSAGRDVLVEKPGAADLAGAETIAETAARTGRCARVGFNHRFHPALLAARRLVDADYGPLMFIRARYGHGGRLGYEHEWRADPAVSGGGELIDQGIHLIDLTRFLAGDVTLAFSDVRTTFWPMNVEDNAFLALDCASGGFAWLHASWTEWKNLFSLEIMLERAKIEISGLGGSYGAESLTLYEMLPEMGPPLESRQSWDTADTSWSAELSDVAAAIAGGEAIGATIDDAVAALRVVDAAYASDGRRS